MAVKAKLTIADGPLANLGKNLLKTQDDFNTQFARNMREPTVKFNKSVQTIPANLPGLPFVWSKIRASNEKARRWWFAAINGHIPGVRIETEGGRYKRKSTSIDAGAMVDKKTGNITIEIPDGKFGDYVVGARQVPSHARTPWPRIDKESEKFEDIAIDVATDTWLMIGNRVADK